MLQVSQLKHVALATLLATTALIGTVGHVFAQDAAVAMPHTAAAGPEAIVIPAPAEVTQAIILENAGTVSVIVLPAEAAESIERAVSRAVAPSHDSPLDNPTTAYSSMPGNVPWVYSVPSSTDVLTSDDPPLDNPQNTAQFSNTPWKG